MSQRKGVQITRYEITTFVDKRTGEKVFGVRVHVVGSGWCGVANGQIPVLRYSKEEARKVIADMKKQRDKDGFRLVDGRPPVATARVA
jgi:hypothetical protein